MRASKFATSLLIFKTDFYYTLIWIKISLIRCKFSFEYTWLKSFRFLCLILFSLGLLEVNFFTVNDFFSISSFSHFKTEWNFTTTGDMDVASRTPMLVRQLVGRSVCQLVGWSDGRPVGWSVSWSIGNAFTFLAYSSSFCITAPAQPHATGPVLYMALFTQKAL